MKWWENLIGIFYQPAKVFEGMKDDVKWRWVLPLAVVIAVSVVAMFLIRPVMIPEISARMAQNPNIPPEQLEAVQARVANPVFGIIGSVAGTPLLALLVGLAFWAVFSMMGAKTTFGHMFMAAAWAMMVNVAAACVRVPLVLIQQTIRVHTSLALILPPEMEERFIFRLLAQLDLFTVWMLFVMAVGFSIFTGVDRRKSYTAVYAVWGLWALIAAALGGMFHFGGMG